MERGKADFRALREELGLTQKDVAEQLGVQAQTVKKWEALNHPYDPPESAWMWLEDMDTQRILLAERAVDAVKGLEMREGAEPQEVTLKYFRDQDDYNRHGRDDGPFGLVNARSRSIAKELRRQGFRVRFVYPDEG